MKKAALIILFIINAGISKSQNIEEKQAIAMLKTFYTAYMSEFSKDDVAGLERTLAQLRQTYCTAKCEKQYKRLVAETDSDPIIKAQDSDAKLAKSIIITRNLKKPNQYTVSYSYEVYKKGGKLGKEIVTINLLLIKENGHYKINHLL